MTRTFSEGEIATVLCAIDRHLSAPARILIVGPLGPAPGLEVVSHGLRAAIHAALVDTGIPLPIRHLSPAEIPWQAHQRSVRAMPELAYLEVLVVEPHDLVLSHVVRDLDVAGIEPLHFDTLVERYRTELTHASGDPQRRRSRFLATIDRLFGELARARAKRVIG